MNRLIKKCLPIFLSLVCLTHLLQGDSFVPVRQDQAPVVLNKVSNLLKWSDLIVVAVKDKLGRGLTVEEIILNKRTDIDLSDSIELGFLDQYKYITPVVMREYRYLFFLNVLEIAESEIDGKEKIVCKITGGGNGLIALFDQDVLENHPDVLWFKRISPNSDRIKTWENRTIKNFGTKDGLQIKEAVERIIAVYEEKDAKAQAMLLVEGLRSGNPAMIRLSQELLIGIEMESIDKSNAQTNQ